ncbi:C2H2 type zinc-finger-domain-containing protein [Myxozyma melibiosi]|uniref:C2H2 type zinc-finger-domain-containing protein n=1 Tax=Myxozyma melibiosi TaxID=54550 RepID=A0ABR1EZP2_9ASCO
MATTAAAAAAASAAEAVLYTCNSCAVGFPTADLQRRHMKTDWHRYNLKRRVATLPPISAEIFAERVLQQMDVTRQNEERASYLSVCRACGNKRFTSAGAYENHISSARHRENAKRAEENRAAGGEGEEEETGSSSSAAAAGSSNVPQIAKDSLAGSALTVADAERETSFKALSFRETRVGGGKKTLRRNHIGPDAAADTESTVSSSSSAAQKRPARKPQAPPKEEEEEESFDAEDEDEDIDAIIARKLKNAVKLPVTACIFCSAANFADVNANVNHMRKDHGFYIPEQDYLVDLEGLITYLSEKVSIGNACLYCAFIGRNLNSVRDHMIAKRHCTIPYDTEDDRMELSDFYDFSSSYPEGYEGSGDDEWDDVSGDEAEAAEEEGEGAGKTVATAAATESTLFLDPSGYELSLPLAGLRIGHRSLARYYRQSLRPTPELREGQSTVIAANSRPTIGAAVTYDPVRDRATKKLWKDQRTKKNQDIRREMRYINQQKHFRDPMLGG